ncbi:MAG TPA: PAS domain S-box protein [Trichocoleus sp.]
MTEQFHRSISSNKGSSQNITQGSKKAPIQEVAEAVSCPAPLPSLGLETQALQILDGSDDCIKVLDLEGRILFMNRGGQALLGIQDITPFLNTSWVEFWQSSERQAVLDAIARAGAGKVCSLQGYCPTLNGEPKWWDNKISPILGADGTVERLLCISRDITDRKRREANTTFLAEIADDFSRFSTAEEIMQITCAKTVAHFDLSRCLLVKINEAKNQAEVVYDFSADGLPSLVGTYQIGNFHTADEVQELASGRAIVINNTATLPRTSEAADRFTQLQIGALVNAPYVGDGQWKFVLSAMQTEPRLWCNDEIEMLQELSARVCLRIERAYAEAALRESEAKYRSLFESIDEGFCLIEVLFDETGKPFDYRFLEANPAFEKHTGLVNAIGKTIRELAPQIEPYWSEFYGRIALTGVPERFENVAQQLGRFYDVYAFRVGKPQERKVAVLFNDISDRKQTEVALRESEERFRLMADAVPQIVWITDSEGRVEFFNKQWSNYTGVAYEPTTAAEVAANFVHPDDGAMTMEAFNQARQTAGTFTVEHRVRAADGTYRWFLVKAEPHHHPETGEIIRWFGASVDIHDRKQAEAQREQLLANERHYAKQLQGLTEAALAINAALSVEEVLQVITETAAAIIGAHQSVTSMTIDQNWSQAINTVHLSEKYAQWRDYDAPTDGSGIYACVCHLNCPVRMTQAELEAHPRWKGFGEAADKHPPMRGWLAAPLVGRDGRNIGLIQLSDKYRGEFTEADETILVQLAQMASVAIENARLYEAEQQARSTAEVAREEAQAANRVKDEFLAVLSHELRSPLNPILGWSKLLQSGRLDETKTAQALATIERNAKLQSELIEDLLDVSRILRGKLSLNVAPVNLAATIRASTETVRLAAEAKSIQITANLASNVGLVSGDSTRLQQVVWNLLSNAVKFTPPGGQVNIRLERIESCAQITVSDTGQGIEPDFLPYVFDYFRQADGATTRKFGGLGLGLAIVRHLIELHGGTVSVASPGEGQGSTFTVRVPLMADASEANQKVRSHQPSLDLSGTKVLVVDDEPDTRELVAFVLEQHGAQVNMAASAHEALLVLPQTKPDVLLSDIGMPEMDGYMLLQQVRRLAPEQGGAIPAIALTAYAAEGDQRKALQVGFQTHITKPVEPEALVEAIVTLLRSDH